MAWRRTIVRASFLAILAAVGYAVHLLLPPAPRWQLQGPFEIIGLTTDSRQFWTVALNRKGEINGEKRGPLQLRELANGKVVAEYLKSEPDLVGCDMSPSGRFVVGYDNDANCLYLIDRDGKTEKKVPLPNEVKQKLDDFLKRNSYLAAEFALFSPNEAYLRFTEGGQVGQWSCLIATKTGHIKKCFDQTRPKFVLDGSCVVFFDAKSERYKLWNIDNDQEESGRLGASVDPWPLVFSPFVRHLIVYEKERRPERLLWDLSTGQMRELPKVHQISFSPRGRWLIDFDGVPDEPDANGVPRYKQHRLGFFDVASGKRVGGVEIDGKFVMDNFGTFAQDELMVLVTTQSSAGILRREMLQLPEGKRLWTKPDPKAIPTSIHFTADGDVLAIGDNIEVWDTSSGAMKFELWSPRRLSGVFEHPNWPMFSKNRKVVHSHARRIGSAGWWDACAAKFMPWALPAGIAFAVDASDGTRLLHVPIKSDEASGTWLSDDNRTFVLSQTDDGDGRIYDHRAYDIPARPRWAWIVGVPVGLGTLVLGWRRWRARQQRPVMAAN